jgi:FdhD protein
MVVRIKDDTAEEVFDQVATEVRFNLIVNGHELVSMHCTPIELDALALGFLVSEGIVSKRSDFVSIEVDEDTFSVRVQLSCLEEGWERNFQKKTITSGCGYGVTFTDGSKLQSLPVDKEPLFISSENTQILLKKFMDHSTLFKETGGVHSAALVADNEIILFSEDIGRHNAVDKIIGKSFLQGLSLTDKILLSSGRISGEIMTKIIRSKIPVLITRAAPTCMSLNYAEFHGVTLIGFARGNRMNVYTHPQAIKIGT